NAHPQANAGKIHHGFGLAAVIASAFGRHRVSGCLRDRPVSARKLARSGWPLVVYPLAPSGEQECRNEEGGCQLHSTSSTSTVSPVTRWASAAATNSSISPSSTACGLLRVTPVRRSFTIWYGWST